MLFSIDEMHKKSGHSKGSTIDLTLFEFVQDSMSSDMLLGDFIVENTKMLNFSGYTVATFTAMSVNTNARFNIGGIAIKIDAPKSQVASNVVTKLPENTAIKACISVDFSSLFGFNTINQIIYSAVRMK